MLSILKTEQEIAKYLAIKIKIIRKQQKISQEELAKKSGVSFGSIKRFENTGEISLKSLLKIAFVLNRQEDFDRLFDTNNINTDKFKNLDDMLKANRK